MSTFFTYHSLGGDGTPLQKAMTIVNDLLQNNQVLSEYAFLQRRMPREPPENIKGEELAPMWNAVHTGGAGTPGEIIRIREALVDGLEIIVMTPETYNAILIDEYGQNVNEDMLFDEDDEYTCGWYPRNTTKWRRKIFVNAHYLHENSMPEERDVLTVFLVATLLHETSHFLTDHFQVEFPLDPWLPESAKDTEYELGEQVELNMFGGGRIVPARAGNSFRLLYLASKMIPNGTQIALNPEAQHAVLNGLFPWKEIFERLHASVPPQQTQPPATITRKPCGTCPRPRSGRKLGVRASFTQPRRDVKDFKPRSSDDHRAQRLQKMAKEYREQKAAEGR